MLVPSLSHSVAFIISSKLLSSSLSDFLIDAALACLCFSSFDSKGFLASSVFEFLRCTDGFDNSCELITLDTL